MFPHEKYGLWLNYSYYLNVGHLLNFIGQTSSNCMIPYVFKANEWQRCVAMKILRQATFSNAFFSIQNLSISAEVCSQIFNWQYISICPDDGVEPNGRQTIIWINVGLFYWRSMCHPCVYYKSIFAVICYYIMPAYGVLNICYFLLDSSK